MILSAGSKTFLVGEYSVLFGGSAVVLLTPPLFKLQVVEKYTELTVKEKGKVEKGNIAIIDFEGFKDGVAFEGGKGENYSLEIGSNTFIPGFEEQVIGMKVGEEKDLDLTFHHQMLFHL